MNEITQSARLRIRLFRKNDAPFLLELLNSPEWLAMLESRHVKTIRDAKHYLKHFILKDYEQRQYGFYVLTLLENQCPIGLCGITLRKNHTIPDLGFGILPAYAGQGFILEAASVILNYIKESLPLKTVDAFATIRNIASQRILEKLDFKLQREIFHSTFQVWVKHYQLKW